VAPRVPPLDNLAGGGKPPGNKPPGGVTNLTLAQAADGTRTMTYVHQGTSYSIQYRPAPPTTTTQPNCWEFLERSFTTGGVTRSSTYCRRPQ
jgi:hypothetical protein